MELTWQEIMSITELQVSQVVGNKVVGGGKSSETGSLAGIEALGMCGRGWRWSKQSPGSQDGDFLDTVKRRAGVKEIWREGQSVEGEGWIGSGKLYLENVYNNKIFLKKSKAPPLNNMLVDGGGTVFKF